MERKKILFISTNIYPIMERKKILFISTNIYPIIGGDSIYSSGLIYRLSKNNNLKVLTFGKSDDFVNHPIFRKVEVISFPKLSGFLYKIIKLFLNKSLLQEYSFQITKFLKNEKLENYDFIILDHLRCYSISKCVFDKNIGDTKIIYVAHNIESVNQNEKLEAVKNKKLLIRLSNNVHEIEKKMIESCDSIWTLTKEDLKVLTKKYHINNMVVKPYFPWKRIKYYINNNDTVKNELLILGSLNWYPNIQGILHFVNDVYPLILAKNDSVKLNIVGQNPSSEILNLANSRIKIYPNVESVDPYILKSDLLIIPNKTGTGSKIKLLESIMKGLSIVTYRENIVGYDNLDLTKPFVVDNENQFCESILDLLKNPIKNLNFIERNLKLIEDNAKI